MKGLKQQRLGFTSSASILQSEPTPVPAGTQASPTATAESPMEAEIRLAETGVRHSGSVVGAIMQGVRTLNNRARKDSDTVRDESTGVCACLCKYRVCACLVCAGRTYEDVCVLALPGVCVHSRTFSPFPSLSPPQHTQTHAVEKESESLKREGSRGERGKGGGQEGNSASAAPGSHQKAPLQGPAVRPSSPPIAVAAQVLASGTGAAPAAQRPAAPNDGSGGNAGAKAAR